MPAGQAGPRSGETRRARLRASFRQRRRDAPAVILDRANARGDLPFRLPGVPSPTSSFGIISSRLLATREPLDDRLAGEITDALSRRTDHG